MYESEQNYTKAEKASSEYKKSAGGEVLDKAVQQLQSDLVDIWDSQKLKSSATLKIQKAEMALLKANQAINEIHVMEATPDVQILLHKLENLIQVADQLIDLENKRRILADKKQEKTEAETNAALTTIMNGMVYTIVGKIVKAGLVAQEMGKISYVIGYGISFVPEFKYVLAKIDSLPMTFNELLTKIELNPEAWAQLGLDSQKYESFKKHYDEGDFQEKKVVVDQMVEDIAQ